jgi:hypothetical protein
LAESLSTIGLSSKGSLSESLTSAKTTLNSKSNFLSALNQNNKTDNKEALAETLTTPMNVKDNLPSTQDMLGFDTKALTDFSKNMNSTKGSASMKALGSATSGMIKGSAKMMLMGAGITLMTSALAPFSSIMGTVSSLGTMLGTGFQPMINDINVALIKLMPYVLMGAEYINGAYQSVKQFLTTLDFSKISEFFTNLGPNTLALVISSFSIVQQWFGNIFTTIRDALESNLYVLVNWFTGIPQRIINSMSNMDAMLRNWWNSLWD